MEYKKISPEEYINIKIKDSIQILKYILDEDMVTKHKYEKYYIDKLAEFTNTIIRHIYFDMEDEEE